MLFSDFFIIKVHGLLSLDLFDVDYQGLKYFSFELLLSDFIGGDEEFAVGVGVGEACPECVEVGLVEIGLEGQFFLFYLVVVVLLMSVGWLG